MKEEIDFEHNISTTISGENFSPRKLLSITSLPLEKCIEKGEVVARKSINKVYEYGSAQLSILTNSHSKRIDEFDELLDRLVTNYDAIKECGGTDISIWVAIFRSTQGNFGLTGAQIQKIAAFKGTFAITYYREESNP
ncbi:hypothetical protein [Spirosoma gilvum]